MKYYAVADIHGYFDELKAALTEQGYFTDSEPHKLIVCGDLFDRGQQTKELQAFILNLLEKDEVILIRGNHEDLAVELLHDWSQGGYLRSYHHTNGTVGTVCQLTELSIAELLSKPEAAGREFLHTSLFTYRRSFRPCRTIMKHRTTFLYMAGSPGRSPGWENTKFNMIRSTTGGMLRRKHGLLPAG